MLSSEGFKGAICGILIWSTTSFAQHFEVLLFFRFSYLRMALRISRSLPLPPPAVLLQSRPRASPQDSTPALSSKVGTSSDGSIFDLSTGVGYNFSRHFGVDLGIPYYFVGTPSSVKKNDPQAVSGDGLGSLGADLKWNFAGELVNYDPTIHLTAPTGETKKGFSTGHATWNWANHLEHPFGVFTPFVDLGVGNTVSDTRFFHRPFITFGYNLQSEGGAEIDAGPLSLTASAYDVAPWGT
jgi:hypothetical protein